MPNLDRPTVPLRRDVYERWSRLQAYLGFSDTSDFADHLMEEYESHHNLEMLDPPDGPGVIIDGITVKQEIVAAESCESADSSGETSPDPDCSRHKDNAGDKPSGRSRKHRSSWGLESVVQRLHQAKVARRDNRKVDQPNGNGWIQAGSPSDDTPPRVKSDNRSGDSGGVPSSPQSQRDQWLSEEQYAYSSPKIIPDSTRTLHGDGAVEGQEATPEGHQDPSYTLRKLLERPPVNASAELRRNAAELKERGVVINPAMYEQTGHRGPPPPYDAPHQNPGDDPPVSQALESLIRTTLHGKGDRGTPTEAELLRTIRSQGGALGDLPQALKGASNSAPSLTNILQQRGGLEDYIASSLSMRGKEKPYGAEGYNMPSAAYALQHLAQMRGPENVPLALRPTVAPKLPKRTYKKRQKLGEKSRRKHKSGSRRKNSTNPTVKSLLDRKKDASLTKYRGRTHSSKGAHKAKSKKKGKEEQQGTAGKRGRKKHKVAMNSISPVNILPKRNSATPIILARVVDTRTPSPPPAAIDIAHSAAQVMKIISGQETTTTPPAAFQSLAQQPPPRAPSHGAVSTPTHLRPIRPRNSTSPIVKPYSPSPSLNNSASEVMKLLASQNVLPQNNPTSQPNGSNPTFITGSQLGRILATPPKKAVDVPPSSLGAAGIMKQLATNYSQSAPRDGKFPLPGLMFCSPSVGDSSNAFSLMKELITKGSS